MKRLAVPVLALAVAPGELVHGFLFFPGEAERARRLRLQVRDTTTGQVDTVELAL